MNTIQERTLLARLQAGDEAAVRDLADRYSPRIRQLALRHLRNQEDAEEVTQDVLLKVCRHAAAFRGDSALSSWIYRITFNTAMSRLRTSKRARRTTDERERLLAAHDDRAGPRVPYEPEDWSAMPDDLLLRAQLRAAVASAVAALPEIYRAPVVLRDIEGLSTQEASLRLHVKDQTLKSRLHRGRLLLRRRLRDFANGLALHRPPSPVYG